MKEINKLFDNIIQTYVNPKNNWIIEYNHPNNPVEKFEYTDIKNFYYENSIIDPDNETMKMLLKMMERNYGIIL